MYRDSNNRREENSYPQYSYDRDNYSEEERDLYLTAVSRMRPNRRKTDRDNRRNEDR